MSIPNTVKEKTCCFSGYRPHKFNFEFNKSDLKYIELESNIISALLSSIEQGYDTFLCGGAMGFDLLCGELVLLIKERFPNIKLICVIPFSGQSKNFPAEWKERYDRITSQCDSVYKISEKFSKACFHLRNFEMVYSSSRLITYFTGRSGGTANTIALAQREKLDIINIGPEKKNKVDSTITYYVGH
ncbi:MAG: DUF1273 family protein [Clostridia bacterium]|nr:DUF1273 family protein [Clostridia bacterium]